MDRHADSDSRASSTLYVLELAGQDDAFAALEARSAAEDVSLLGPGLATASALSERVPTLALTHRASELVGTGAATAADARAILETESIDRTGSVAVRAVDVRGSTAVDTQAVERSLGELLVERGLSVDLDTPDHELRVLFADSAGDADGDTAGSVCAVGWLSIETVRDFGDRQPTDRPFFQPGSMDPIEARTLANVAGARPGGTILDPFCGTGGMVLESALLGARVLGGDVQAKMVRGSRRNLSHGVDGPGRPDDDRYPAPGRWDLYRGDAAQLPVAADGVTAVCFDAPYGRQSPISGDLEELIAATLAESARVADRAVVVADRSWDAIARAAGWTVTAHFERRVHRSLTRHVHVLSGAE